MIKRLLKLTSCTLLSGVFFFTSCKKEYSCEGCREGNRPPLAYAGKDTLISLPADSTTLDGSASTDPDGNIIKYQWTKVGGPHSFTISHSGRVITLVKTLMKGTYFFELTVTDDEGLSSKDTVAIRVDSSSTAVNCDVAGRPRIHAALTQIGTLSERKFGPSVAAAGSKVVFAGGTRAHLLSEFINSNVASSSVDIYDVSARSWSTAQLSQARTGMAAISSGTKIIFAGGVSVGSVGHLKEYDHVDIYDVAANNWSVAHLSQARSYIAAAAVGNKVFFAGGSYNNGYVNYAESDKVDIYDISTNQWSVAKLSVARHMITATTVGSKIFFAGGIKDTSDLNIIDIYDNATGSWSTSTFQELNVILSSTASGDYIYWAGFAGGIQAFRKAEIRNVPTGTVTVHCLTSGAVAAVLRNNHVVFYAGQRSGHGSDFDLYNPQTGKWSVGISNPSAGVVGPGIISFNNVIYIAGGFTPGSMSQSTDHYTDKVYTLNW